jgi:hypothetical protein
VRRDRVGPVEARKHEDVEQLGAGGGAGGVQALPESALQFVGAPVPDVIRRDRCTHKEDLLADQEGWVASHGNRRWTRRRDGLLGFAARA